MDINNASKVIAGQHQTRISHADRPAWTGTAPHQSQNVAQLRKVLSVMFPPAYIKLYHQPPHSVCSLFSIKQVAPESSASQKRKQVLLAGLGRQPTANDGADDASLPSPPSWSARADARLEPSTEPVFRVQVLNLQDQLAESLAGHKAKPVGLCPVRRAIYDQCFDEIIRQVTVGCIEQGLLLFRIRNELRMTVSSYRRLYESAIGYNMSKSLDASLRPLHAAVSPATLKAQSGAEPHANDGKKEAGSSEQVAGGQDDKVARLRDYYENELAKKDEIIGQQRAIMRALNLNPVQ